MLITVKMSAAILDCSAECRYAECRRSECRGAFWFAAFMLILSDNKT